MPSQTTITLSRPALLRHTATESSFSSRSRPGSVAQAIFSRIDLPNEPGRRYAPTSEKWTEFWPTVTRSPWFSCLSWTDSPLTNVPFVLPRSTTQNASPRRSRRAWWPLVAGSRKMTSLSGERPMRSAVSPARWVCPASGPDSIASSACGPAASGAETGGRVGMAIVSATGAGGAGGGCQAGITVVGSRSSAGNRGGATIVAATSPPFSDGPRHCGGAAGGGASAGAGGSTGTAAPAASSVSVGLDADGADHAGAAGTFHGGGATGDAAGGAGAEGSGSFSAAGAVHDGAGGAAGSSDFWMSHDGAAPGSAQPCPAGAAAAGTEGPDGADGAAASHSGATVGGDTAGGEEAAGAGAMGAGAAGTSQPPAAGGFQDGAVGMGATETAGGPPQAGAAGGGAPQDGAADGADAGAAGAAGDSGAPQVGAPAGDGGAEGAPHVGAA